MMKLYYDYIPQASLEREKRYAQAAMLAGIPTPLSGDIIKVGDRYGIVFERIQNKKSIARAIADDPDGIETYTQQFADICKQLHATDCDTSVFPSTAAAYRGIVERQQI